MKATTLGTPQTRFTTILPVALLAAGFVLAPAMARAQANSFKESFTTFGLPANFEESGQSPIYTGQDVQFPGTTNANERRYLRTLANYNNTNFIAEVTVTIPNGSGPQAISYLGLGSGIADPNYYYEPRISPAAYVRMSPDDFFQAFFSISTSSKEDIGILRSAAGDGTHRVRITWNHVTSTLTAAIQKNYTGGPFSPTSTIGTVVTEPFADTNTHIVFGGAGNTTFDDFLVIALDGTPGAIDCHGKSVSGLVKQHSNTADVATALGFPSVAALQNLITGFCGN